MSSTWVTGNLDPSISEAIGDARQLIESIQTVAGSVEDVLDAVKGPAEIAEKFIRTLIDPSGQGIDALVELLGAALAQIVLNFLEADIWFLPLWPPNMERLYGTFNKGPTSLEDFKDSLVKTGSILNTFSAPGVEWVASTLEAAIADPHDPYRPKLGSEAYVGGVILLIGADRPADLGVYAEIMEFLMDAEDASAFFRSISDAYARLTNLKIQEQGTWPDFVRLLLPDIFPTFADYLKKLKAFIDLMERYKFTYIGALIDAVNDMIDFLIFILSILDGLLLFIQILASIQFNILAIAPDSGGTDRMIQEIRESLEQPTFSYVAGGIILIGSENFGEIDATYQIVTALLPTS